MRLHYYADFGTTVAGIERYQIYHAYRSFAVFLYHQAKLAVGIEIVLRFGYELLEFCKQAPRNGRPEKLSPMERSASLPVAGSGVAQPLCILLDNGHAEAPEHSVFQSQCRQYSFDFFLHSSIY